MPPLSPHPPPLFPNLSYESDTVDRQGVLSTVTVRNIHAAFSGSITSIDDYEACLSQQGVRIELIAVGVTEAGLAEGSPAMTRLARSLELLQVISQRHPVYITI
jgi:hypothetical protein